MSDEDWWRKPAGTAPLHKEGDRPGQEQENPAPQWPRQVTFTPPAPGTPPGAPQGPTGQRAKVFTPALGVATVAGVALGLLLGLTFGGGVATVAEPASATAQGHADQEVGGPPGGNPSTPSGHSTHAVSGVTLSAEPAPLRRGEGQEGDWTAVKVTITNNTAEKIDASPAHFVVVDDRGGQWTAQMPAPADGIGARDVRPGETVTGTIAVKKELEAVTVAFIDDLFGDSEPVVADIK